MEEDQNKESLESKDRKPLQDVQDLTEVSEEPSTDARQEAGELLQKDIQNADSINLLLSGTYTKGWRASEAREVPDRISPNTLITDHPEAILREGRVVNYFECPDCGFMIEVTTDKRPIEVHCVSCGSRFRLKGKRSEIEETVDEKPTDTDWDEKSKLAEEAMKYHRRGDLNKAVEVYDKILKISSNDPVVWNNKGVALDGLGMHILAVKCYEKAIIIRDTYVDAWFNFAYSQYRMKQFQKAIESLRKLLRLKPDHSDGNKLLDKCEEELKLWKSYI